MIGDVGVRDAPAWCSRPRPSLGGIIASRRGHLGDADLVVVGDV